MNKQQKHERIIILQYKNMSEIWLDSLIRRGNMVIVIEHNTDVMKLADYIIDIGPEGGDKGGTIVAHGTPEEIAANPNSYTGKYIDMMLKK